MPVDFPAAAAAAEKLDQFSRKVLWLDDGEGVFQWTKSGTGGDDLGDVSASAPYFYGKKIRAKTRTTATAIGDTVTLTRYVCYPSGSTLFYRLRFCLSIASRFASITFQCDLYDGTRHYRAALKYSEATPKLEYLNSAGTWTAIAAGALAIGDDAWQLVELGLDLSGLDYGTVYFAGASADLAGNLYQDVEASTVRRLDVSVSGVTDVAAPIEFWLDAVYVGEVANL